MLVGKAGELERLTSLHASGAITDAEFATLKSQIIGGRVVPSRRVVYIVGIVLAAAAAVGIVLIVDGGDDASAPSRTTVTGTEQPAVEGGRTFVMDGMSMAPMFRDGDEMRVLPVADTIARGDIVIFAELDGATASVGRVIAVGDESIEMTNCIVMVDGRPIEEPYLDVMKERGLRSP